MKNIPYSAYFLSFPVVIDTPGKYRTRSGETVEVSIVDTWCKSQYTNGIVETWHRSGRIFSGRVTDNDIVNHA